MTIVHFAGRSLKFHKTKNGLQNLSLISRMIHFFEMLFCDITDISKTLKQFLKINH